MKSLVLALGICCAGQVATAQTISGDWNGSLAVQGTTLPIVFHIKDSAGIYSASFDSPKQMAYNLPCSGVMVSGDTVRLLMKNLGARYEGVLEADKKNSKGIFYQGALSLPLELTKTSEVATRHELKRPQTPRPPFPYFSEDVLYTGADTSIQIGGTFTYPQDKVFKKYPAVLLITGSGQQDRDESIFEHKPFAVIADYLTRNGFAVLRVDDRGIGKSTGTYRTSTTADFAADVAAGVDYLKTRKDVDLANIGLIGHSEGGIIAPMVASQRKDIRFIVLLAGPGVPVKELMQRQIADVGEAAGVPAQEMEQYKPLYGQLVETFLQEADPALANKKAIDLFDAWQRTTTAAVVEKTTGVKDEKSKIAFINSFAAQLSSPWFNYFMRMEPAQYLKNIHCALLALNGDKDIQVAASPNLEAIRKTMLEQTVKTFKVQSLPGLNHLFQHCNTCSVDEYGELEETFAPEALELITNWIKQITGR